MNMNQSSFGCKGDFGDPIQKGSFMVIGYPSMTVVQSLMDNIWRNKRFVGRFYYKISPNGVNRFRIIVSGNRKDEWSLSLAELRRFLPHGSQTHKVVEYGG